MEFDKVLFCKRLKQARLASGMTQAEAGKRLGYKDYTSYQSYETGRRVPGLSAAVSLAVLFGVSLDWLVGMVD